MAAGRSFAEYEKDKCYNGLCKAAEENVNENWESLNLYTWNVHRIGAVEMVGASVQPVYVRDLLGMRVTFEVGPELELYVKEGDYHYDEGDLSCGPDDWTINKIEPYSKNNGSKFPVRRYTSLHPLRSV